MCKCEKHLIDLWRMVTGEVPPGLAKNWILGPRHPDSVEVSLVGRIAKVEDEIRHIHECKKWDRQKEALLKANCLDINAAYHCLKELRLERQYMHPKDLVAEGSELDHLKRLHPVLFGPSPTSSPSP
jgi:hypothetical protein